MFFNVEHNEKNVDYFTLEIQAFVLLSTRIRSVSIINTVE